MAHGGRLAAFSLRGEALLRDLWMQGTWGRERTHTYRRVGTCDHVPHGT